MSLSQKNCIPCHTPGIEPLGKDAAQKLLAGLEGWSLAQDAKSIQFEKKFKDFAAALHFVNQVGEIAEAQQHHPDIELGWGYVRLTLFTHAIGGLHENDFILASKINESNK